MRSLRANERLKRMKALSKSCGCNWELTKTPRQPTDKPIVASAEELAIIRSQLLAIETMLAVIFGDAYSRAPESLKTRAMAADLIERHFDGIVDRWAETIVELIKLRAEPNAHPVSERREWNA